MGTTTPPPPSFPVTYYSWALCNDLFYMTCVFLQSRSPFLSPVHTAMSSCVSMAQFCISLFDNANGTWTRLNNFHPQSESMTLCVTFKHYYGINKKLDKQQTGFLYKTVLALL